MTALRRLTKTFNVSNLCTTTSNLTIFTGVYLHCVNEQTPQATDLLEKQMTDEKISKQARAEALKIARGIQRPGQKKEQTKLIAQGIEKGITEFRKREKAKARDRDKLRKKELKVPKPIQSQAEQTQDVQTKKSALRSAWIPWLLLLASWAYFLIQLQLLN